MWHTKYEKARSYIGGKIPDLIWDRPYLENDDRTAIRRIGALLEEEQFEYRGEWRGKTIVFAFTAGRNFPGKDTYQVDLCSSLLRLDTITAVDDNAIFELLKIVMKNVREALSNFPELESRIPVFRQPKICRVEFVISLWARWSEFSILDFGEHVL